MRQLVELFKFKLLLQLVIWIIGIVGLYTVAIRYWPKEKKIATIQRSAVEPVKTDSNTPITSYNYRNDTLLNFIPDYARQVWIIEQITKVGSKDGVQAEIEVAGKVASKLPNIMIATSHGWSLPEEVLLKKQTNPQSRALLGAIMLYRYGFKEVGVLCGKTLTSRQSIIYPVFRINDKTYCIIPDEGIVVPYSQAGLQNVEVVQMIWTVY